MYELKPYRIEWRQHLNRQWMRIEDLDTHPGNLNEYLEKQGWVTPIGPTGYWRLISQHVIEEVQTIPQEDTK